MLPEFLNAYVLLIKSKIEEGDEEIIKQINESSSISTRKIVGKTQNQEDIDENKINIKFGGTDVKNVKIEVSNVSGCGKYKIVEEDGIYYEISLKNPDEKRVLFRA